MFSNHAITSRTLYKSIAGVLFVLVTITYLYPLKTPKATTTFSKILGNDSASSLSASGLPPSAVIQTEVENSTIVTPTSLPPPPDESSVKNFSLPPPPEDGNITTSSLSTSGLPSSAILQTGVADSTILTPTSLSPPSDEDSGKNFSSTPPPQDGNITTWSTTVQGQEPNLLNLLNQTNSSLNESSIPNNTSTRLNGTLSSEQENASFVNTNSSDSLLDGLNVTKLNETGNHSEGGSITVSPLNQTNSTNDNSSEGALFTLPLCPSISPLLRGFVKVRLQAPSLADIGRLNNDLDLGGHYRPPYCRAQSRVAIIIPFRDREEHLRLLLHNLIKMLKRQQIEFNIFVIEQEGSFELFNRAMLLNVGFVEANKRYPLWQCFIFHDVDLIPENDYNLYHCPIQPRHLSVALDKYNYTLLYESMFGGVSSLTKDHFMKVNGFSNMYWGWGAEDDDMASRINLHGLNVTRPSPTVARYKMLQHGQEKENTQRMKDLDKGKKRLNSSDGLSNLNYVVEQITLVRTHTLISVQLIKVDD